MSLKEFQDKLQGKVSRFTVSMCSESQRGWGQGHLQERQPRKSSGYTCEVSGMFPAGCGKSRNRWPAAPKGAFDIQALTARLKACPDTNRVFFCSLLGVLHDLVSLPTM